MKVVLLLALCGLAAAAPRIEVPLSPEMSALLKNSEGHDRNWLIFEMIRLFMRAGSPQMGIPPLDPFHIDQLAFNIPAEIVNLNLEVADAVAEGLSGFVVHTGTIDIANVGLKLDITLPTFDISTEHYDFTGDLFGAIPLYGKGRATFNVKDLRFRADIYLGQSANGKSIVIDRIENVGFQIGALKSALTGAIGGGDIDAVINALISEVVVDYLNRFQGALSAVASRTLPSVINPILESYDTWDLIDGLFD